MSHAIPSDEVAEDYTVALQNLTLNSRYEISNLTVIAKENTEHALAISEALKNHIKQTSPQKKLPAFYVLDSIVKNVGTPYTLFFGRQLYSTFMEAYALVDNSVRRKMDEMLKTWKEPVPGSIDVRPVFPQDVTRPIENALIKARTSAIQATQEQARTQQQYMGRGRPIPSPAPYRETPTPPNTYRQPQYSAHGNAQNYPPPNYPSNYAPQQQYPPPVGPPQYDGQNGHQQYGLPQRPPSQQQYAQPPPTAASWQQPQPQGYGAAEGSVEKLNSDISNLIAVSKADFAQNPWDSSIQTRLKALLDLQTILQSQKLPPEQIALIKNQVAQLSVAAQPSSKMQTPPAPVPPTPVAAAQQPAPQHFLGLSPEALAALSRQSATPQPVPQSHHTAPIRSPQPSHSQPLYQPTPSNAPASAPVANPGSLLEQLRARGLLPSTPTTTSTPTPTPLNAGASSLPPGFPPPFINTPPNASRTPLAEIRNDVVLKPASLKLPRPHLISSLYEKLGVPCTQCGRRFQSDEEGKKKKTAHMDWHFRVHQRMADAEKRGQHRSWYVDEMDWIKSREVDDGDNAPASESAGGTNATGSATNNPKLQYLPVPDDPVLAISVCPICTENFEKRWLDEAQDFVWMDAKEVGGRIYHASCYAEATKDIKRNTPEPVLGKRKAEDDQMSVRNKIKAEPM